MEGECRDLFHQVLRLNRLCFRISYDQLEALGLYPGQPQLLMTLMKRDGISQRELAEAMGIKPATLTVMLRRMAGKDYVQRKTDAHDQRITRLYLTSEGRALAEHLRDKMDQVGRGLFGVLTSEERGQLSGILSRINGAISEKLPGEEASRL